MRKLVDWLGADRVLFCSDFPHPECLGDPLEFVDELEDLPQPVVERIMGKPGERPRKVLFVGLHFGAIELPALWAVRVRGLDLVTPMETIANPDLQSYFERTRSRNDKLPARNRKNTAAASVEATAAPSRKDSSQERCVK